MTTASKIFHDRYNGFKIHGLKLDVVSLFIHNAVSGYSVVLSVVDGTVVLEADDMITAVEKPTLRRASKDL